MQIIKATCNYDGKKCYFLATRFYPYARRYYSESIGDLKKGDFIFITYVDDEREERIVANNLEENYAIWRYSDKEDLSHMFQDIGEELYPLFNDLQIPDEYSEDDERECFDVKKFVVEETKEIFQT